FTIFPLDRGRIAVDAGKAGDSAIYAATLSRTARVGAVELEAGSARYADLSRILAYWERKRGGSFAPRRADIDPVDLVEALPRIMLADVLPSVPVDFRYRLSGTGICDVHGANHTNRRPRDLSPPEYGVLIHAHYAECVARRVPLLHLIVLDVDDRELSYARLL